MCKTKYNKQKSIQLLFIYKPVFFIRCKKNKFKNLQPEMNKTKHTFYIQGVPEKTPYSEIGSLFT